MPEARIKFSLFFSCLALAGLAGSVLSAGKAGPLESPFVGVEACKGCHAAQHSAWEGTKHAKAMSALTAEEQKKPECFKCHVTGYGMPGGFVSREKTPQMAGVGCEACHGGGTAHVAAPMEEKKGSISVNGLDCRTCHNPHIDTERCKKK